MTLLAALSFGVPTAQAADGLERAFTEKLGSIPVPPESLANGTRVVGMGSTAEVADDLKPYGIVGVAYVGAQDDAKAGSVAIAFYVFSDAAAAQAFPAKYFDEVRAQAGGWVAEFPLRVTHPKLPDSDGKGIATWSLDQGFCFFVDTDLATVIHIAAAKPDIAPGTSTKQIGALVARRMNRATEDVIVAARNRLQEAALAAATE
jgi:hypothetical protein